MSRPRFGFPQMASSRFPASDGHGRSSKRWSEKLLRQQETRLSRFSNLPSKLRISALVEAREISPRSRTKENAEVRRKNAEVRFRNGDFRVSVFCIYLVQLCFSLLTSAF